MANETETIIVEVIDPNSKPFAIIAAYRPPESNPDIFFDNISNAIKALDHEKKEKKINCDLNCNRGHRATSILNSLSEIYQLEQLIDEPTRCTENTRTLINVSIQTVPIELLVQECCI